MMCEQSSNILAVFERRIGVRLIYLDLSVKENHLLCVLSQPNTAFCFSELPALVKVRYCLFWPGCAEKVVSILVRNPKLRSNQWQYKPNSKRESSELMLARLAWAAAVGVTSPDQETILELKPSESPVCLSASASSSSHDHPQFIWQEKSFQFYCFGRHFWDIRSDQPSIQLKQKSHSSPL